MIIFHLCHLGPFQTNCYNENFSGSQSVSPKKGEYVSKVREIFLRSETNNSHMAENNTAWKGACCQANILLEQSIFPFSPVFIQLFWTSQLDDEKFCWSGWRFDECENAYNPVLEHRSGSLRPVSQLIVTL